MILHWGMSPPGPLPLLPPLPTMPVSSLLPLPPLQPLPPTPAPGPHPAWGLSGLGLAWLAGLAWHLQLAELWPLAGHLAAGAAAAALMLLAAWLAQARARLAWAAAAAAVLLLALASAGLRAQARLDERLASALEGADVWVTGVVARLPQTGAQGTRFVFEVEDARRDRPDGASVALPPLLSLGWYDPYGADDDAPAAEGRERLRAGQRWRLPLRLKQAHASQNPQGFDAELLWFEQGLGATGHVRNGRLPPGAAPRLLASGVAHPVEQARQAIRDDIRRQVPDARAAGVLAALVVGDQSAIDREDWDLFRRTGIAHLVSISGVHVTMLAWLAAALAGRAWRRSSRLMLAVPAPLAARLLGLAVAAAYALLAGWGVPAQRTVLMLATAALLRSAGRHWPWPLVLLAAAVVVTVIDPWALLQPGFWLSFTAVGLLMASDGASPSAHADPPAPPSHAPGAALRRWGAGAGNLLGGHLRAQVVATLGLAPLSLVFFQQLSLVGFLANLLAIPLVTLLITPLALLGVLLPGLWWLAAALVQAGVQGLAWLAAWPAAVHLAAAAPAWAVVGGLLGAVLGVLPLPLALRLLALPLLLPLLWPPVPRPAWGTLQLLAADVGQGTAVLVRTRDHLLVYDSGPLYSRDNDAGQRVLLPLLQARGEPVVDTLMISHSDIDHAGGAASLLAGVAVRALHTSLPDDHALRQRGLPHTRCEAGQRWQWDGVDFEVLHPQAQDHGVVRKTNALSCVLRLRDQAGRSLLLTGDIEAAQEQALVDRLGPALASSVLLVPHHGSRTSSTAAFLAAVAPQVAVVQAGYRSRYGHPAPDVMARYQRQGIEVVRTDRCGAWLWHDGAAACTRDVRRRYWHWRLPAGGAEVANLPEPGLAEPGAPPR